jgi:NAD+ synthase (glutamine-hydrolysing)
VRIALAQVDPTVGDIQGNCALIAEYIRRAREAGAALAVFPELAVCGYPPEDLLLKDHFLASCRQGLDQIAAGCDTVVAIVGVPLREGESTYNSAAILAHERVAGWYRKIWLPNYGVFDEARNFVPGQGVGVVKLGGVGLGLTVCEDIWNEQSPAEAAVLKGEAEVILNLSMSPYHRGRGSERETLVSNLAKSLGAIFCYVNGVGGQDELVFDGQSMVFDQNGRLLARAAQFQEELLLLDIDPAAVGVHRRLGRPAKSGIAWPVEVTDIDAAGSGGRISTVSGARLPAPPRPEPLGPEAEVYAALCLGVKDYSRKNGFAQAVLGVSGGIDSALTACVAADALGAERVNAVSMPSRFSSAGTRSDAQEVAERLGAHYYELPIEKVFGAYLESLAAYLDPEAPGTTEQNIQARIRGNLLMALSNRFGWLVLATGNKSEMAVGYATLYGDMAGGFAVLKDVPKTLVYRLAEYRNSLGPGVGPIPASTIARAPSAELAAGQTDQDTLPPYEILDQVIEAYVVRDESVEEIVGLGLDRSLVQTVVAMIDGNEYKRRQAAPGVRITPKAFGKDRRLPITNRYRG